MKNCTTWLSNKLDIHKFLVVSILKKEAAAEGFTRQDLKKAKVLLDLKSSPIFGEYIEDNDQLWYRPQKLPTHID